jgi:hypothetical protein
VLLELTPATMAIELRAVDDQTDSTSPIRALARFVVEDRRPGARPA